MHETKGRCVVCGRSFVFGKSGIETATGDKCNSCAGVIKDEISRTYQNKKFKKYDDVYKETNSYRSAVDAFLEE
jgi:hypothetical protein